MVLSALETAALDSLQKNFSVRNFLGRFAISVLVKKRNGCTHDAPYLCRFLHFRIRGPFHLFFMVEGFFEVFDVCFVNHCSSDVL